MTCSHGRLFCEPCDHTSTQLEVTHFFASEMEKIYTHRTAGSFTFVGLLYEYHKNMHYAENS
jgi:hypothetical protein